MNHRLEIMQIVERLNAEQNVTVFFVSHDLNLSAEFCGRLLLLDHGRLAADGPPASVLQESRLRDVYHCEVRVETSVWGSLTVLPAPRLSASAAGRKMRVHLIAGGGSGEEILRRLRLGNHDVTCGVLNQGDTDTAAAASLEVEAAVERPFSPVGPAAFEAARAMVAAADAVILSGVPFGPGNLPNLELAEQALALGKRVLVMRGIEQRDYTKEREASRQVARLLEHGAVPWENIAELFRLLSPPAGPHA
jgi:iron complex transport system ATP-binding protein